MIIMGIDPGLATVGFAIIDASLFKPQLIEVGIIKTKPDTPFATRLNEIHCDINALIKEYKPNFASIEQLFFSKNITNGIQVAHARGVIVLALEQNGILYEEFSPSALKLALTGDGKATKTAIQKMLCLELNLNSPPKPDDASDALSLALCAVNKLKSKHSF